jgi:hypothetical protein
MASKASRSIGGGGAGAAAQTAALLRSSSAANDQERHAAAVGRCAGVKVASRFKVTRVGSAASGKYYLLDNI